MKTVGQALKDARKAMGLTQAQLALRFGCRQSFVADVERGNKPLPRDMILKIPQGRLRDEVISAAQDWLYRAIHELSELGKL